MKKVIAALFIVLFSINSANASCSYRTKKKMLHNNKVIKNKVINAQVKGKMLAIQELAKSDYCNDPQTKSKIKAYEKQIQDLTNEKLCLKREYKASLSLLRASR